MAAVVVYDLRAPFSDAVLSEDERARVRRFTSADAARRWAAGRAGLRQILATHAGREPADLILRRGAQGKPFIEGTDLRFNKSDCGDLAVVALCDGREVGVDVEAHRLVSRAARIADRFFSETERAEMAALPEDQRVRGFFDCWTIKEAVLKCDGGGLGAIAMASFSAPLDPDWQGRIDDRWWANRFRVGDGFSAAVVLDGAESDSVEVDFTSPTADDGAP